MKIVIITNVGGRVLLNWPLYVLWKLSAPLVVLKMYDELVNNFLFITRSLFYLPWFGYGNSAHKIGKNEQPDSIYIRL